jgi:nuclear RNA export factor
VDDFVFIQVSKDDVADILRLNDFTYAGAKLTITETQEPWPHSNSKAGTDRQLTQGAIDAKEKLKNVLFVRYNTETRVLDLSALGQDQTLVSMDLFEQRSTAEKAFKALVFIADEQFATAQAKAEAIQGVSLASNGLDNVATVYDLAEHFPQLKMLDLSNNGLDHMRKLSRWRHKFRALQNLVLTGNPIETQQANYQAEVLEWFPRLQFLNGLQVRTVEEIEAKTLASRPTPIPQAGSDFRDVDGIGEGFLRTFFPLYDTDRVKLLSTYYDDQSKCTLSVVTHSPKDNSVPVLPWQPYLRYSRNMVKIQTAAARIQRLLEGVQVIGELWRNLPVTKHPDLTEHTKYIIDCHPLAGLVDPTGQSPSGVGGLIITVHGEFDEIEATTNQVGKRSFSRTFVLGPGVPGRNAIRVISDMLSLRAWNPVPQISPPVTSDAEEQKKQMVLELSKRTNMTLQYSELCLSGVDWDFDKAFATFTEKKVCILDIPAYINITNFLIGTASPGCFHGCHPYFLNHWSPRQLMMNV